MYTTTLAVQIQIGFFVQLQLEAQEEKCLPTDLLDDEDNEDAELVEIKHPPAQSELMGASMDSEESESEIDIPEGMVHS